MRTHTWALILLLAAALPLSATRVGAADDKPLRPPAVPLVTVDPYFSIWSPADRLTDAPTVHWTHEPKSPHPHRLTGLVRIDGKAYRLMGDAPAEVPALNQLGVTVLPTRTIYEFAGDGVQLTLTFMTPFLPDDLMVFSRPLTYVSWTARATDGRNHAVAVYLDAAAEVTVHGPEQAVTWETLKAGPLTALKVGTVEQPVLRRKGDRVRIDWGYFYLAADLTTARGRARILHPEEARQAFLKPARINSSTVAPPAPAASAPVLAIGLSLGRVGARPVERRMMLAYDDIDSAQYFGRNLKGYWKKDGMTMEGLLETAAREYGALKQRCAAFDEELMADLRRAGGENYARICALAYRQSLAASKVVADANGQPLFFCKENSSNGCMGTVDVFYPQAPQILLLSPSLSKAMLVPVLEYASSPRWKFPFAPHDVGTWPKANGQVYGGGERNEINQMPVEETGNMLLLLAAVARMEGNADFAGNYWPVLVKWAEYLKSKGFDPENQLCTDDFAGHLAHNVNLSAKAICALGAFGRLAAMRGETQTAESYGKLAKEFAARWAREADDGDHLRLAFDKPGTWSQKYNLVWDRILGLGLFPEAVLEKEMAYYKKIQNRYGLPLDNRKEYTKLDWTLWTATLTGRKADFEAIVNPVYDFLNETPDRLPMSDWYQTKTSEVVGFIARPVVGGVFIRMLYNAELWKKWAARDRNKAAGWAPLPVPPKLTTVAPTARERATTWRYTTQTPGPDWFKPEFDAAGWQEGPSGFGAGAPGATIRTPWKTPDIWIRREVELPARWSDLQLKVYHDEDVEIYVNGVRAAGAKGYLTDYEVFPIHHRALETLKGGKAVIAAHCHQSQGGQFIDIGLVDLEAK